MTFIMPMVVDMALAVKEDRKGRVEAIDLYPECRKGSGNRSLTRTAWGLGSCVFFCLLY